MLEPHGQFKHVLIGGARMRGDEIGNQVLFFARFCRVLVEQRFELVIRTHAGFHHLRQRAVAERLGCNFEVAAGVVLSKFLDVFG